MHTHIWLYICISIYISTQALLISIMLYQPNHAKLWKHTTLVSKIQDTFCYFCQSLVFLLLRKNSFHTELISVQPWSHLSVSSESKETLSVKLKTASRFDKTCCVFFVLFFFSRKNAICFQKRTTSPYTPQTYSCSSQNIPFFSFPDDQNRNNDMPSVSACTHTGHSVACSGCEWLCARWDVSVCVSVRLCARESMHKTWKQI